MNQEEEKEVFKKLIDNINNSMGWSIEEFKIKDVLKVFGDLFSTEIIDLILKTNDSHNDRIAIDIGELFHSIKHCKKFKLEISNNQDLKSKFFIVLKNDSENREMDNDKVFYGIYGTIPNNEKKYYNFYVDEEDE